MGNIITMPFAALLRWLYEFTASYGLSIILFALVIKLVLLPFQMKSKRSMMRMGSLSKKQQELQKQYANNQKKYQEELAKLYQEENVNPASGCLWSFLPLLILMPLYSIVYRPITHFMGLSQEAMDTLTGVAEGLGYTAAGGGYDQIFLTDFIHQHWADFQGTVEGLIDVDFNFLGLDLSRVPTSMFSGFQFEWSYIGVILIPVIAAGLQYFSSKIMARTNGQTAEQNSQMRDLEYRKKQLQRLQEEVVDLEDIKGGVSITDMTFTDFKTDLMYFLKDHRTLLDKTPLGLHAVTRSNPSIEAESGVIFVLKQLIGKQETRETNPMYPYYIAYIGMDGTVKVSYVHAKKLLDIYKKLCSGEKHVITELTEMFNQETDDGHDMSRYSNLLDYAVNDIIGRKNEAGVVSLFSRGGTTSQKSIGTPEDFEIVTFLVVR